MIRISCLVEDTALTPAFRAEHGLSFFIETPNGCVLFDTGESGDVLLHNASELGIDLREIDALAISHAHQDHTGGLPRLVALTRPGLPFYASPDLFRERFVRDSRVSYGMPLTREALSEHVDLRLSAVPAEMVPGVWTTGEILERDEFEGRGKTHVIWEGGEWKPDPYQDDFSLVVETPAGLIVILGCAHAGVLNILKQVRSTFPQDIVGIIGGTHLLDATENMLKQTEQVLRDTFGSPLLYPNHCTGQATYDWLHDVFGDRVRPCHAGSVITF